MSARFRLTAIYSVPDFDRWAEVIGTAQRRVPGVERMTVHRSVDDPNEVMVELEVESVEIAQTVLKGENLHDLLDRLPASSSTRRCSSASRWTTCPTERPTERSWSY